MKKQSFLHGALILMIAGIINRIIGFVLRIIIVRSIGDEGLGLFQMVYPLFMTLLLISTAGFPVAISKLIPERLAKDDLKGSYNLLKVSLLFTLVMSTFIIITIYFSAEFITSRIYSDSRTYIILLSILPAIIFSSLAACFRGFFQGMHTMMPTALSQITEQLSRLIATLIIINIIGYLGLRYQAAGIAAGIAIGEFSGLVLLASIFFYNLFKNKFTSQALKSKITYHLKHRSFSDFKLIAGLAVPITLGRVIHSLLMSGEAVLIPRQLELSGLSVSEATSLYGQLSGMVEQVIFLPTVITIALTISLVPNISDAFTRRNMDKIQNNYQDVIRISCYLGFPITLLFYKLGPEICNLLFGYPQAGQLLAAMAFCSTFIYYLQVSHGMLNGLGKPQLAVINMAIGSTVTLIGIFYLTKQSLGIYGAAISIGLGITLSALLNYIAIGHNIGYRVEFVNSFIKPLIASAFIFFIIPYIKIFLELTSFNLSIKLKTVFLILILILIYLLIMILIRAITKDDLNRFRK